MKKYFILLVWFFPALGLCQSKTILTNNLFTNSPTTNNSVNLDYPIHDVAHLSDGTVIFMHQDYSPGAANISLVKYARDGSQIWSTQINEKDEDYGLGISIGNDGKIYVIGTTRNATGDYNILLSQLQSDGTLLSTTTYDNGDNYDEIPISYEMAEPGTFIVVGQTQSYSASNGLNKDAFICKINVASGLNWLTKFDQNELTDFAIDMEIVGTSAFVGINTYGTTTSHNRGVLKFEILTGIKQFENVISSNGHEFVSDLEVVGDKVLISGRKVMGSSYVAVLTCLNQSNLSQSWEATHDGLGYGCTGYFLATNGTSISWATQGYDNKAEPMLFNHLINTNGSILYTHRLEDRATDGITNIFDVEEHENKFYYLMERGSVSSEFIPYILVYDHLMQTVDKINLENNLKPTGLKLVGNDISVNGYKTVEGSNKSYLELFNYVEFQNKYEQDTIYGDTFTYQSNLVQIKFKRNVLDLSRLDNDDFQFGKLSDYVNQSTLDELLDSVNIDEDSLLVFKAFPNWKSSDTTDTNQFGKVFRLADYYNILNVKLPSSVNPNEFVFNSINCHTGILNQNIIVIPERTSSNPNDGYYWNEWQFNLHKNQNASRWDQKYLNASIEILGAWELSTGANKVKVAVAEAGPESFAQFNHNDLTDGSNSIDYSVIEKGGKTLNNKWVEIEDLTSFYFHQHSTGTVGAIGALRNNNEGISGIAGGNGIGLDGVGIYNYDALDLNLILLDKPHILNNSWKSSSGNVGELLDLYKTGVTVISARNNDGNNRISYPSTHLTDLTLSVGAAGNNGLYYKLDNSFQWNDEFSSYGRGLDVIAPAAMDISSSTATTKTQIIHNGNTFSVVDFNTTDTYLGHNKTSGAAPLVSGLAALLIDYKFDDIKNINTLFPEDIEHLIELGATDIRSGEDLDEDINADKTPNDPNENYRPLPQDGYDELTGWGRVNASRTMKFIESPYYDLVHLDQSDTYTDVDITHTKVATDILTRIDDPYHPNTNQIQTWYKCDIYRIDIEIDFSNIFSGALSDYSVFQLAQYDEGGAWPIHSYSNLLSRERKDKWKTKPVNQGIGWIMENYVSKYLPYLERTSFNKATNTVILSGYIYHQKESGPSKTNTSSLDVWYPFDLTNLSNDIEFGFTVHIVKDGVGLKDLDITNDLNIYPNPASNTLNIETNDIYKELQLNIIDVTGRIVFETTFNTPKLQNQIDISSLMPGSYIIKVQNEEFIKSTNLIKE